MWEEGGLETLSPATLSQVSQDYSCMSEEFTSRFEEKVKKTIQEYELVSEKDKVLVACSGGKDSTTALYLLNKLGYQVEALTIDLLIGDWSQKNLDNLTRFCTEEKIFLHVISLREELGSSICHLRSVVQAETGLRNCTVCGVIKRWLINKKAHQLGATKLATGHTLDDEVETIIMNLCNGSPKLLLGLGPKTGITDNEKFVQRIKPLYFCTNQETRKYSEMKEFPVLYEPCPCSVGAFRRTIRNQLRQLEKQDPHLKTRTVKNFVSLLPALRRNHQPKKEVKYCRMCGEPSRGEVCRACEILKIRK